MGNSLANVDYASLDRAKNAFIAAGRKTASFAKEFGFMPGERFGASANVFSFNLAPYLDDPSRELFISLLPEGLGTADDARPDDLTADELKYFWSCIATKTLSCLTNDAASSGLQTILVSLYLPSSTPETVFDESFVDGFLPAFVEGCRKIGCVYFSGETPQLKGKIVEGKLDIAGALFAVVPPGLRPIDGTHLAAGNKIVLVESSGPHENGFTVLRGLAPTLPNGYRTRLPSGEEFWRAIQKPSHLYTPLVQSILKNGVTPTAIENITGHGWQKIMRSNRQLRYRIKTMLPVPEVFKFVQEHAQKSDLDMYQTFNCGSGCAIFLSSRADAEKCVELAEAAGIAAVIAGETEESASREVVVEPIGLTLASGDFALARQ